MFVGGVCCAVVLLALGLASAGWGRRRDVCLVLARLGVLLKPVAHFVLAFFGFVVNPRHYVGDYWAMQRDSRVEAIVVALTLAVLVAGTGLVGATSRPRSGWRLGIGAIEVVAGVSLPSSSSLRGSLLSRMQQVGSGRSEVNAVSRVQGEET